MEPGRARRSRGLPGWRVLVVLGLVLSAAVASARESGRGPAHPEDVVVQPPSCVTPEEATLARLINDYRRKNKLPPVPLSVSLVEVAKSHVYDLRANKPARRTDPSGNPCSLHSWSGDGPWNSVCYTAAPNCAEAMWEKPRELTKDTYPGHGFENAYWTSRALTPELALDAWKRSPSHNALLVQSAPWTEKPWKAMGVALFDHYAVVWFGDEPDPLGEGQSCDGRGPGAVSPRPLETTPACDVPAAPQRDASATSSPASASR